MYILLGLVTMKKINILNEEVGGQIMVKYFVHKYLSFLLDKYFKNIFNFIYEIPFIILSLPAHVQFNTNVKLYPKIYHIFYCNFLCRLYQYAGCLVMNLSLYGKN